jgi:hypothetical protein
MSSLNTRTEASGLGYLEKYLDAVQGQDTSVRDVASTLQRTNT